MQGRYHCKIARKAVLEGRQHCRISGVTRQAILHGRLYSKTACIAVDACDCIWRLYGYRKWVCSKG